jgi:hypothetical protein
MDLNFRRKIGIRVWLLTFTVTLLATTASQANAEFPGLANGLETPIESLAPTFGNSTVLVSVAEDTRDHGWDLSAAIETEILAQLLRLGVDAYEDDTDERMSYLNKRTEFDYKQWQATACHDFLILAQFTRSQGRPQIAIAVFSADDPDYKRVLTCLFNEQDLTLENNIPELNQELHAKLKGLLGQTIGKGNDPVNALLGPMKELDCRRVGVFTLGRTLAPGEAIVPGDVFYFANARIGKEGNAPSRFLSREFMLVSELINNQKFAVYYMNTRAGRKPAILGEDTFDLRNMRTGSLIVYRPLKRGKADLPLTFGPIRKSTPNVDWTTNEPIDLFSVVDPKLDTVHGAWAMKDNGLWFGYERQNKLQIPVYLPPSYSLKFTARRNFGKHGVSVMPIVAGRQVMLTIDGFDGATTGIGLVDGNMEDKNETKVNQQIFKQRTPVNIEIQVRDSELKLFADGQLVLEWRGDPKRLDLHKIHRVPSKNWLHLSGYESDILITSMTLERL